MHDIKIFWEALPNETFEFVFLRDSRLNNILLNVNKTLKILHCLYDMSVRVSNQRCAQQESSRTGHTCSGTIHGKQMVSNRALSVQCRVVILEENTGEKCSGWILGHLSALQQGVIFKGGRACSYSFRSVFCSRFHITVLLYHNPFLNL